MTQQLDIPSSTPMKVKAKSNATQTVSRKRLPAWASVLIATNGIGLLGISIAFANPALTNRVLQHPRIAPLIERVFPSGLSLSTETSATPAPVVAPIPETAVSSDRTSLTYEQWLDVLKQEAAAVAKKQPERLTVLLGDSLSLWFPADQLPTDRAWLNQGISGDTTAAMVKRISFLDETKPQTLFVMAGINDFKKGSTVDEVLESYRTLVQTLKQKHPSSEIVVQAVLPHGAEMTTTVDDPEKVLAIPNDQIVKFNQKLANLAKEEQLLFLNLHPLFADKEGFLRSDLTTDGLHLNPSGYMVWSTALQTFSQTQLRNTDVIPPTAQAQPEAVPANPEVQ